MKSLKANRLVETIIAEAKEDFNVENIIGKLKELRVIALEEQDPAIVKILRLTYEHLENNESFDLSYSERRKLLGDIIIEDNFSKNKITDFCSFYSLPN